jgi:class 3 adenylate cyclase
MPNLRLVRTLAQTYDLTVPWMEMTLAKSYQLHEPGQVLVSPTVMEAFQQRQECTTALVFTDIVGFSKLVSQLPNQEIVQLLERYYAACIPSIYENGGQVEKLIGDGIIASFGEPFVEESLDKCLRRAEAASYSMIKRCARMDLPVRCAVHEGQVFFLRVGTDAYGEYTMIGRVLTELWRLESAADQDGIWFFNDSAYGAMVQRDVDEFENRGGRRATWLLGKAFEVELAGIGKRQVRRLRQA